MTIIEMSNGNRIVARESIDKIESNLYRKGRWQWVTDDKSNRRTLVNFSQVCFLRSDNEPASKED